MFFFRRVFARHGSEDEHIPTVGEEDGEMEDGWDSDMSETADQNNSSSPVTSLLQQMAERIATRAVPYIEENQRATLMIREDQRRDLSFDIALQACTKKTHVRKFRGGNAAYEMAHGQTLFFFCCGACGTRLFRPQDLVQEKDEAVEVSTIDSDFTFCVKHCDVVADAERIVHSNVMSESIKSHWTYLVRTVRCPRCKVYLGVKVVNANRGVTNEASGTSAAPLLDPFFGMQTECSFSLPSRAWLEQDGHQEACQNSAWTKPVDQFYIATRYLRVEEAHTGHLEPQPVPLQCVDCQTTLSYVDQTLCYQRRWGFGDSMPEPSCYMNSMHEDRVILGQPYPEQLGQGPFMMADMWCKCGKQVGYKFIDDRSATQRNIHHIGRFGLVNSCVMVKPNSSVDETEAEEMET